MGLECLSLDDSVLSDEKDKLKTRCLSLARKSICELSMSSTEQIVLNIKDDDIVKITNKSIKIEPDKIIADIKKR